MRDGDLKSLALGGKFSAPAEKFIFTIRKPRSFLLLEHCTLVLQVSQWDKPQEWREHEAKQEVQRLAAFEAERQVWATS